MIDPESPLRADPPCQTLRAIASVDPYPAAPCEWVRRVVRPPVGTPAGSEWPSPAEALSKARLQERKQETHRRGRAAV